MVTMVIVCSRIVSISNGMSSSYHYENAKDNLRWNDLSVQEHIGTVMTIGKLINLPEDKFDEVMNKNEYIGITVEDLKEMYK